MNAAAGMMVLFSVLIPSRIWTGASKPLTVRVDAPGQVRLVLTEFSGREHEPNIPMGELARRHFVVAGGQEVDLREHFPMVAMAGTYVLYAVPPGKEVAEFLGTPLVVSVRPDRRAGAAGAVVVTKIEPLRYAVLTTDHGPMTMVFYYDSAPNTVEVIQGLMEQGFYDGLTFHRVVRDFLIQGGDPRGDGKGGPGFQIDAEFSDRQHERGTVSMARVEDPLDRQRGGPRPDYANSAGSQFFICVGREPGLDRRYTVFARVVDGLETVKAISELAVVDDESHRPSKPPVIRGVELKAVTAKDNPYAAVMKLPEEPKVPINLIDDAAAPATQPAVRPEEPGAATGKSE